MAELAVIRARLLERAAVLGRPTTADPDLHLIADGTAVAALYPCRSSAAAKPSTYGPLGPPRRCARIFGAEK